MSQKKEAPVRPPRTRLERLIAKKPPATSDLTIRFNALSDEDNFEDELAILVNNVPEDNNSQDSLANITNQEIIAIKQQKLNRRSTSLDNKESTETWSIFSDLRGKITKTFEDNWEHYRNNKEKKDESKELTLRLRKFDSLPETNLEDQFKLSSEIDGDIVGDQNESLLNELFAAELPDTPKSTNQSLVSHLSFDSMNKKKKVQPVSITLSSLLASTSEAETPADEIAEEAEETDVFICEPVIPNVVTPIMERPEMPVRQKKQILSHFLMTKSTWIGVLAIFIYLIIPLPSYLSGLIMGSFTTFSIGFFFLWLFKPAPPKELPSPRQQVPAIKECQPPPQGGIYKGWMNELPTEYIPDDYHINQTHSIYVRLEGSTLRLSRPKNNIPKRAMWDEPRHETSFVHQRHFEIKGSTVNLLPVDLSKKRLWSKKYPICIHLAKNSTRIFQKFTGQGSTDKEDESYVNSKSVCIETKDISDEKLYLFARTCREKEEWFRRLHVAVKGLDIIKSFEMSQSANNLSSEVPKTLKDIKPHARTSSTDSSSSNVSTPEESKLLKLADVLDFQRFMSQVIPLSSTKSQFMTIKKDKEKIKDSETFDPNSSSTTWLNAFLFRIFWDSLRDRLLADFIRDKIQRKLEKIKVPYFMDELTVTDIDMGVGIPIIQHISPPAMDYRGLWIDFEITYDGSFRMTLETKLNLMRLKKIDLDKTTDKELEALKVNSKPSVADSEAEDSAESSSDEEIGPEATSTDHYSAHNVGGGSTSKKILRFVDKIAQSKYFQLATEYKYFKRAMEGVSNTRLILTMEVHQLIGTLVINIPPPPTDRLWYGFRGNPQMQLSAKPKFGEREVSITHVTEWIEKKLHQEFQKIFVMPNMDDFIIPIMLSCLD